MTSAPLAFAPPRIQPLDLTSLRAVLWELRAAVLPSRFEKAQQIDLHTLQLGLRGLEGPCWLELSWLAEAPRLLAIPPPRRQGEGSTLARQLQHGLRGLALVELCQSSWERVVELRFAPRPAEPTERFLVLELMGRHSNLFLLDRERRVIALGRQVRSGQSRLRPIGTGDAYPHPPRPAGEPPRRQESQESWRRRLLLQPLPLGKALLAAYQGISPALVRQLLPQPDWHATAVQDLGESQWQALFQRWHTWLEALEAGRFALRWQAPDGYCCWSPSAAAPSSSPLGINRGLAGYYRERLQAREQLQRRSSLEQRLRAALRRERELLEQQQRLLEEVPTGDGLQRQADALLCLPQPDREQISEAQALYRRARKLRRSVAAITPRLALHRERLAGLETSLTFLEQLEPGADLGELEAEVVQQLERLRPGSMAGTPAAGRRERRSAAKVEPSPLELTLEGGLRLQVGRNHRQNEWISLHQARRGDLWFHAQELPGSHVVLKGSERHPDPAQIQLAADLAAHFSRGRANRRVPVLMVPSEALQRIPGAEPGTVRHRGGEVIWGEPQRAESLLRAVPSLPGAVRDGAGAERTPVR